ncbi:aminotransferase class I/II-fold pyridoxal phosphate-dependent enzyme, partial [Aliarcobacter butzleri]
LEGEADKDLEMMRAEFEKRKDHIVTAIQEQDGLSWYEPDGAFYVFINIKKLSNDSMKFWADLLDQQGVALVPGLAFGMEGY